MISYKTSYKTKSIVNAFKKRTWEEKLVEDVQFTLFWTDVGWIYNFMDTCPLKKHQLVNHFRNNYELCKKDLMARNMKAYWKKMNFVDAIIPQSFELKFLEFTAFCEVYKRKRDYIWIIKPAGKSQGKGIVIITKLAMVKEQQLNCKKQLEIYRKQRIDSNELMEPDTFVVQHYINNPLLIGNRKFDIRLYVLVTSFQPLIVYIHEKGFCRFSQSFYSNDYSDLSIHATNVAIQKTQSNYDASIGCKWNINRLRVYLTATIGYLKTNELFIAIEQVILLSLFAVQHKIIQSSNCFELFGYDILIDSHYKPWLIEVNASPSLSSENQEDLDIKTKVLSDMLDLLQLDKPVEQVNGFHCIYNKSFITTQEEYQSTIGAASYNK